NGRHHREQKEERTGLPGNGGADIQPRPCRGLSLDVEGHATKERTQNEHEADEPDGLLLFVGVVHADDEQRRRDHRGKEPSQERQVHTPPLQNPSSSKVATVACALAVLPAAVPGRTTCHVESPAARAASSSARTSERNATWRVPSAPTMAS